MSNQRYDIIISDAALAMLDSHVDFLARVSRSAVVDLVNKILADIESLGDNPQRYPAYENQFISDTPYRKMLSSKRYLIIYEVSECTVFVDYIVDCRQDYEWLLR